MRILGLPVELVYKLAGVGAAAVGVGSFVALSGDSTFLPARVVQRYTLHLDRRLRFLFLPASGKRILRGQVTAALLLLAALTLVDVPYWYAILALITFGPALHFERQRKKRIEQLELQVDGFILALANGLKTVPSPGAALQAIVPVLRDPTRQEVERVLKEMRVGATLEQALLNMAGRVQSRAVDAALAAVIVGIQVGGNLPQVLETTAISIREMNRLEGVIRTKTADGKNQLWVLVLFPFGMIYAFSLAQPGYFDPLQKTFTGYLIMISAALLWLAALVVARKVLTVDI